MAKIEPLHTQIQKTIQTAIGSVVMENPKGFPRSESNLYCRGQDGKMIWQAEKPEPAGLYNRVMFNSDGYTLAAYTVTGQACELDLSNGKLISQVKMM